MISMMQKKYLCLMSILLILIQGCGLNQYKLGNINNYDYSIAYEDGIPRSLEKKIDSVFKPTPNSDGENVYRINIKNYKFDRYDVYAGQALRSLEVEVKSSIEVSLNLNDKQINKSLVSIRRFNSNELNPLADQEMLDFIKNQAVDDLVNQLFLEVNLIDM
tara:strand:+ start:63 stop:545 length:483 start_codon:yes stop_codon:yes gene_type:complete